MYSEIVYDLNPKHWTRQFRKNSVWYVLLMAAFYHGISIVLWYAGSALVTGVISDYQAPSFPVSITMATTSGPIEEAMFFGIPFYLSGSPHVMLVTGTIWSVAHIFSTQIFSVNGLGYAGFLATIPHLFFSLRTWYSGKGWFAVLFHSSWDVAFLLYGCYSGLTCVAFGKGEYFTIDMLSLALTGLLLGLVSVLYYKNKIRKTQFKIAVILSLVFIAVFEAMINLTYAKILLPS